MLKTCGPGEFPSTDLQEKSPQEVAAEKAAAQLSLGQRGSIIGEF